MWGLCQATPSFTRYGDTYLYGDGRPALARGPQESARAHAGRALGSGVGELERFLEVAEAVAAALDIENVGAVQQAVEDGGSQDLVAGEQLGPVADALVRRDE